MAALATPEPHYRIGVDIGGTFTDFVLLDTRSGRIYNEKVLTTPADPSQAVLQGIGLLMAAHKVLPHQVAQVIHGTTLVANALIERKGVRTALVTTRGFADVLELGLEWRYDTYDLKLQLPPPLAPRELRFEVAERIGPDGRIIRALDEASVLALVAPLRAANVRAVAVCLLHSFRNPLHEDRVKWLLANALPDIVICTSSDVVPEIGEYERMSTTLANAYVLPLFERYIAGIAAGLKRIGIDRPLFLTLSDGGTVHQSTAIRHPIRLVQSGPAGGVQAATLIGASAGASDLLCFDMGGTTAKACLIDHGEPLRSTEFEVARVFRFKKGSGLPLRIPVIEMIEIGAGGGSIARIDRLGLLQVGTDSASAEPGPACYGRGGTHATVTDADLVLGYLGADSFLGGDMRLDVAAARAAIERHIATPLALSIEDAAWGLHDLVNENMARATAIHALEKAKQIGSYAMVPIGGAGPVHAASVARKLGLSRIICPSGAGVASAFGFLAAAHSFAFVRGRVEALARLDFAAARAMIAQLEAQGRELMSLAGADPATVRTEVIAAMRYIGQGFEVDVTLDPEFLRADDRLAIASSFANAYRVLFGRTESAMAIEIVSWRVMVSGPRPVIALSSVRGALHRSDGRPRASGMRSAWFAESGGYLDTPVYQRHAFSPDQTLSGPALIEERESTLVVPPGARVHCDASANLLLDLGLANTH